MFDFTYIYVSFIIGEELSKKQAAQEAQMRKLRAQVCWAVIALLISDAFRSWDFCFSVDEMCLAFYKVVCILISFSLSVCVELDSVFRRREATVEFQATGI